MTTTGTRSMPQARPAVAIPLVDLGRQYGPIQEQVHAAFRAILQNMQLFLGPNVQAFEQEYAAYLGAGDCVGVGDGTTALHLALRACGIGAGDEVITVSHTFFATVEAIALAGATPVFVDVDPDTLTMDVAAATSSRLPCCASNCPGSTRGTRPGAAMPHSTTPYWPFCQCKRRRSRAQS